MWVISFREIACQKSSQKRKKLMTQPNNINEKKLQTIFEEILIAWKGFPDPETLITDAEIFFV